MKIYFAGSIRGGRNDAELYQRIIQYLKKEHTVLTEHIGDLSLSALEGSKGTDKEIYLQDTGWLKQADILICEGTNPSLGVGYELAYAEARNIPCHVFYDCKRVSLSAMIKGDDYFKTYPYENEAEIYPLLDQILQKGEK